MSQPEMSGNGVWLPTGLAVAMFDCYFGSGPRYNNRFDPVKQAEVTKPAPHTPDPAPEAPTSAATDPGPLRPRTRFIPRGVQSPFTPPPTIPGPVSTSAGAPAPETAGGANGKTSP